jgi:hypothetical protein
VDVQVPGSFSAAQAVSIASQVSSRDKDAAINAAAPAEPIDTQSQLEKSAGASADRDAQGQGDGLGSHDRKQRDANDVSTDANAEGDRPLQIADPSNDDSEPPELIDLVC